MQSLTSPRAIAAVLALSLVGAAAAPGIHAADAKDKKTPKSLKQAPLDESKLNCKQLSGRVQVLILQVRTYSDQKQSSGLSRGVQSVFAGTVGTNAVGVDPQGTHAADIKKMQDFNQQLVAKGCNSYDLDAEMKVTDPAETPTARVKPVKSAAGAGAAAQKPN